MPRVMPLNYHYSNEPSICDAIDYYTHVPYISDALHIIRSVFKPHFIHYTKYAKYAFLLLSSIITEKAKIYTPYILRTGDIIIQNESSTK